MMDDSGVDRISGWQGSREFRSRWVTVAQVLSCK
jgi:hypothetical protein